MTSVTLRALRKEFGATTAVAGVDLEVPAGGLFFLLGPSGCGKTTLLRMIAGFTEPTSGQVWFGDRDVTRLPPEKRNAGMVFQGYALWPHMTVRQNVAFGLDVRKVARDQKRQRVEAALDAAQILELADRKPHALSGGQQQRVALARALVIEPTVLLLDEPLSNLDAKLRSQMRSQIRRLCTRSRTTAVYVTHDQKEALSMADELAVMRDGLVVQTGSPRDLYRRPRNRFVADFLGETNFLAAQVRGREGQVVYLDSAIGPLVSRVFPEDVPTTGNVTCSIRPEALRLGRRESADGGPRNRFEARRGEAVYLGEVAQYTLAAHDGTVLRACELNPALTDAADGVVEVTVDPQDVVVLAD